MPFIPPPGTVLLICGMHRGEQKVFLQWLKESQAKGTYWHFNCSRSHSFSGNSLNIWYVGHSSDHGCIVCVGVANKFSMLLYKVSFQYPIRSLIVRSRGDSKRRDMYLEWYDVIIHRDSHCFETSRDLTTRDLIGYWTGALVDVPSIRQW